MEETTNIDVNESENTDSAEQQEQQTFTQADMDRMISKMAEKFEAKYEKKYKQQVSLAGLDEKERAIAEKDMALKEMEERLKNYELNQSKLELTKVLNARGLSTELIDIINITGDVEVDQKSIDKIDKVFKAMVADEVKKRIGSNTPKTSTIGMTGEITKDDFRKMTLQEQAQLYTNNKQLYEALTK